MTEPTLAEVYAARARISDVIRPTPLMRHALLAKETGLDLWVKHENHTAVGAFKIRGLLHYRTQLVARQPEVRGVIAATRAGTGRPLDVVSVTGLPIRRP